MIVLKLCILLSVCACSYSIKLNKLLNDTMEYDKKTMEDKIVVALCLSTKKLLDTCEVHTCNDTFNGLVEPDEYDMHHFIRENPKLKCKEETSISLAWKDHHEYAYFLEIHSDSNSTLSPAIVCAHYTILNLEEDTEYRVILWGFSFMDKRYFKSEEMKYKTFPKNHKVAPVTGLRVKKHMVFLHDAYEAVVEWEPNHSCYFHVVWFEDSYVNETKINIHTDKHELKLKGLQVESKVTLQIRAMESINSTNRGNETLFRFVTTSCLETYASLQKCVPEIPQNVTIEVSPPYLSTVLQILVFDVTVSWSKPDLVPDLYTIDLQNYDIENSRSAFSKTLNVSGDETNGTVSQFVTGLLFSYNIKACSLKGCSKGAGGVKHRPEISNIVINSTNFTPVHIVVVATATIILLLFGTAACLLYRFYRKKPEIVRRRRHRRYRYAASNETFGEIPEENEQEDDLTPHDNIELQDYVPDPFELDPDAIVVESVVGEGAFGVVRKARIKMPDGTMKQVAIKMLKANTTSEEIRQFIQEIEIMKSVRKHPNIVSFIGCTKANYFEGPMLIVEYCSRGDLQSYLRNAWEMFCLGSRETMYYPEESPNDSSRFFANKTYDILNLNLGDDFIIQPKHLLSIARQVALGMEHLAKTRVVHRDLAARNVLVCENHSVKVSDFGMSRDVYQDNVYCKNGGGKLPIRWMAIESLTHQKYTSQSDVWSFGILLWEIVTLGGTPYVGMQTSDLLDFLKSGQRLSCPGTCSPELFSIMNRCWKTNPKNRPTFTDLYKSLDKLLENVSQYLSLENIEIPFNFDDAKLCKQSSCDSDAKPNNEVS